MTTLLPTPLPARLAAAVDAALAAERLAGIQLAVSVDGQRVIDHATGDDGTGRPLGLDAMLPWFSMTKAATSTCALQQWERGAFALDDPVVRYLPEFARGGPGKDAVTIRHLFTHTGGFRPADGIAAAGDSPLGRSIGENLERIHDAALEPGWVPGERAGYHPTSGMTVLAAIVEVVDGRPFGEYVRAEVFDPLGMPDCWIGMPPEAIERYEAGGAIATMLRRDPAPEAPLGPDAGSLPGAWVPTAALSTPFALGITVPGGHGRGPMTQLANLYEALVAGGVRAGNRILSTAAVEAMFARHRVGMFDETFRAPFDWGLGLHVDTAHFGRHCSPRAAGHGGAQSSVAFGDPRFGLAVACVCNGMTGLDHVPRMEELMTALYLDLDLVAPDAPGRDHAYPGVSA